MEETLEETTTTPGVIVSIINGEEVKVDTFGDLNILSVPTILRIAANSVEKTLGI
jgi:hypothetical protein